MQAADTARSGGVVSVGGGSERGIAWRCRDSISLREFLGFGLEKAPPDHSTLSKTRKRLSVDPGWQRQVGRAPVSHGSVMVG